MFHILTTCSIFLPVGNDCFVQLAGRAISDLTTQQKPGPRAGKRAVQPDQVVEPTAKRQRVDGGVASVQPRKRQL